MQLLIYPFFVLLVLLGGFFANSDFEPITSHYLSPEYMYLDMKNGQLYVGLSSHDGVAVFDTRSNRITEIITMPSPVKGVFYHDASHRLYATAGKYDQCIYVYDLKSKKHLKSIKTGFGPGDIEYSWEREMLFVTNRFSNDVSVIDILNQKEVKRIKANREPVALAISPNDKLLAVANLLPSQAATENYVSAKITLIDIENLDVIENIELPNGSYNLKDIAFSHDGKYIYVTHLIGRYNVLTNQIEKGWINTNALTIIDATSMKYYTTVLLDDIHKGAANPHGLILSENGKKLCISITGTNELFVIDRERMHAQIEQTKAYQATSQTSQAVSGADEKIKVFEGPDQYKPMGIRFEDISKELSFLAPVRKRIPLIGIGPTHLQTNGDKIYISSFFSDGLEIIDPDDNESVDFIEIGIKDVKASRERYGELLFHNAEKCFQQWQSCASCHPGEGRIDGLNWDLMNDGIGNPKNTKSLLLSHKTPPAMATGIRADAETGVRAGFKFIQFFDVSEEDAKAVDAYLKSLEPVPSPYLINGKLTKSAKRGKLVFEKAGCIPCHSGPYYTDMQQRDMGDKGKYDKQTTWDTPTLIELWRTAPYLHDGRYSKLDEVFRNGKHGIEKNLTEDEFQDLTIYLLSL